MMPVTIADRIADRVGVPIPVAKARAKDFFDLNGGNLTGVALAGTGALVVNKFYANKPLTPPQESTTRNVVLAAGVVNALITIVRSSSHSDDTIKDSVHDAVVFDWSRILLHAAIGGAVSYAAMRYYYANQKRTRSSHHAGAGANSTDIFHAQYRLGQLNYGNLQANGVMDAATTDALKRFQATYSLQRTDGSVNPETLAYLDMAVKQMSQIRTPFDPEMGAYHEAITHQT